MLLLALSLWMSVIHGQIYVATDDSNKMRIVSNDPTCYRGRVEAYDSDYGWGTMADCWTSYASSYDGETMCESVGFSGATSQYLGATDYVYYQSDTIPSTPTYCATGYVYCGFGETYDVCDSSGCTVIAASEDDDYYYCDSYSGTCHSYDYYVVCYTDLTVTCTEYSSYAALPTSGNFCRGYYYDLSGLATGVVTAIIIIVVICCLCAIGIPLILIFCCGVAMCACCAKSSQTNNTGGAAPGAGVPNMPVTTVQTVGYGQPQQMGMQQQPMGMQQQPMGMQQGTMYAQPQPMGMQQQPMGMQQQPMGMQQQPVGMGTNTGGGYQPQPVGGGGGGPSNNDFNEGNM